MSTTKKIVRIAIFACILFCQEQLLSFIPNVQFTQCLIAIFFISFGLTETLSIILVHVLLDNLIMGSLNLIYTPAMMLGWMTLPLLLYLLKLKNRIPIAITVALHSIVYSLCFAAAQTFILQVPFIPYIVADLPFTIILIVNGFTTTFLLLEPCTRVLRSKVGDKKQENIREEE